MHCTNVGLDMHLQLWYGTLAAVKFIHIWTHPCMNLLCSFTQELSSHFVLPRYCLDLSAVVIEFVF